MLVLNLILAIVSATLWSNQAGVALAASSDKPELHHTLFDNLPSKIFYFDDTPVRSSGFSFQAESQARVVSRAVRACLSISVTAGSISSPPRYMTL
jgi:hypothetical protein